MIAKNVFIKLHLGIHIMVNEDVSNHKPDTFDKYQNGKTFRMLPFLFKVSCVIQYILCSVNDMTLQKTQKYNNFC